ncbi:hypothetical protein BCD64_01045 [Nostoc sp. MBR 210]|nr:hypothetical protein BCD64_01045 [Nostoc sp. MBR 210]
MDAQRHQAYLDLTEELLRCDSTRAPEILQASREFVDTGWVEWLEQAAIRQEEQGNLQGANQIYNLRDYAAMLVTLETAKITAPFWNELWQAILQSNCNPQVIEPLLKANLDKLIDAFAQILPSFAANLFSTIPPEGGTTIAGLLVNFSNFMFYFPLGSRASNLEIAIAGYNIALDVFTQAELPQQWAIVQNSLGAAYNNRLRGERAENLEEAIAYYQNALQVYTQDSFPEEWAMLQNNLGTAYSSRILGDRAQNPEQAILCHQNSLQVYTEDDYPVDWARAQYNLGVAHRGRIQGEPDANLEQAIACFRSSLLVRTRSVLPMEWAETQKNLGVVYCDRQQGNKARNLERAINYLHNALQVYTQTEFPAKWAETQKNLGVVYWQRLDGEKAENLERAIACYQNALQVYTKAEFPETWAETQNALAVAWQQRILGERHQNLAQAINCYQEALQVRTQAAFPIYYAETQLNLGVAYRDMHQLHLAYSAFVAAVDTVEFLRSEIVSGDIAKRKLAEEWHQLYINIVEVSLELAVNEPQYISKAITYVERSKTRQLVELVLSRDNHSIFPPDIASQLQQLQDEINQGQQYIQSGTASNSTVLAQKLHKLRQQRNILQDSYLAVGSSFDLAPFLASLDDRTAVIEWFVADGQIFTFVVTSNTGSSPALNSETEANSFISVQENQQRITVWRSTPEDLQDLANWLEVYLKDYYQDKDSWQTQLMPRLEELARNLHFDRLLSQLPQECNQLILIPHRFLHILPLHASPVFDTTLIDRFSRGIRYAPSCQLLQLAQTRQRPNFKHLFAIQNPTSDLSYAAIEVEAIKDKFEIATVFQQLAATKAAFSNSLLQGIHCVHFACHGIFDLVSPLDSALQLADGPLTLAEILKLDLQQARLVTLSACETGLTDPSSLSDEYIGLPSGFLYAGTPSLVSSLWTVNDLSTSFLMLQFYHNLRNGSSVATSLNLAQLWLRDVTKTELKKWIIQIKLPLPPTVKMALNRRLHQLLDDSKPFCDAFHWAGFCAVGV